MCVRLAQDYMLMLYVCTDIRADATAAAHGDLAHGGALAGGAHATTRQGHLQAARADTKGMATA